MRLQPVRAHAHFNNDGHGHGNRRPHGVFDERQDVVLFFFECDFGLFLDLQAFEETFFSGFLGRDLSCCSGVVALKISLIFLSIFTLVYVSPTNWS